jgi:hypothetical protein
VCHLVRIGVSFEQKHAVQFLSVLLSIIVIMHVAVLKLPFDQYTLCTGGFEIFNISGINNISVTHKEHLCTSIRKTIFALGLIHLHK